MEINRTQNVFYYLIAISVAFILTLGSWWIYLFLTLANKLKEYNLPSVEWNLVSMLKWEGITFFVILLILATLLFYVFWQDQKKTKAFQAFFSSLTHELKTPLASIRLQSQVLNEMVATTDLPEQQKNKLKKYTDRLKDDTVRLENELDKLLQLSRLERGAPLNQGEIHLLPFIKNEIKKYPELETDIHLKNCDQNLTVMVDEAAFSIILRNLFENSLRHAKSNKLSITITVQSQFIELLFDDHGAEFTGNIKELGRLFYKHNSPKGSGIGLYLSKKLVEKMQGKFQIKKDNGLKFILHFPFKEQYDS
jgi:signal transduction histidine kinase